MSDRQFGVLVITLLLGFGGYFAHPILGGGTGLLVVLVLVGAGLVWCLILGWSDTQQARRELAPRMLELARMDLADARCLRPGLGWSEEQIKNKIRDCENRVRKYEQECD
jgi:hypothetical protein